MITSITHLVGRHGLDEFRNVRQGLLVRARHVGDPGTWRVSLSPLLVAMSSTGFVAARRGHSPVSPPFWLQQPFTVDRVICLSYPSIALSQTHRAAYRERNGSTTTDRCGVETAYEMWKARKRLDSLI